MLIEHLPRESATARAIHGPAVAWGDAEHLLAVIVDTLAGANWQRGGGKGPRPRTFPRPGVEEDDGRKVRRADRPMPIEEAAGFFKAWREGAFAGGDN